MVLIIIVKYGALIEGKFLIPKFMLFPLYYAPYNDWKQYFITLNSFVTWVVTLNNIYSSILYVFMDRKVLGGKIHV